MVKVNDRIRQQTSTVGAGTISLDSSVSGFQDFSVLGDSSKTYYAIEDGYSWEVGIGTYSSNTLTRDTVLVSSNSDNKISLGGSAYVFVTYPAAKSVYGDDVNVVYVTGLSLGSTGLRFNDGTIQTTAAYAGAGTGLQADTSNSTLNAVAGTTSVTGIVKLQNSINNSTTTALTPKAVNAAGFITTISLDELSDTLISSPSNGQMLK